MPAPRPWQPAPACGQAAAARNATHRGASSRTAPPIPAPAAAPRSRPALPRQARAPGSSSPWVGRSRRAGPPARRQNSESTGDAGIDLVLAQQRHDPLPITLKPRVSKWRCISLPESSRPGAPGEHAEGQRGAPVDRHSSHPHATRRRSKNAMADNLSAKRSSGKIRDIAATLGLVGMTVIPFRDAPGRPFAQPVEPPAAAANAAAPSRSAADAAEDRRRIVRMAALAVVGAAGAREPGSSTGSSAIRAPWRASNTATAAA